MNKVVFLPIRLLVLLAVCALSLPIAGQTKKGFKALDKQKWDEAFAAFALDSAHQELKPVALFGMAKTLSDLNNPNKNLRRGMYYQTAAKVAWKSLKPSQRNELTKDWDVKGIDIDKLRTQTANAVWKTLNKDKSTIKEVDEYINAFPSLNPDRDQKAREMQESVLERAIYEAKTYQDYAYLSQNHRKSIPEKFPSALENIDDKAITLFLESNGIDKIGQFFKEVSNHPISKDRQRERFADVYKATELRPLVTFINDAPRSAFATMARQKALDILKKKPLSDADRAKYPQEERNVLVDLELEASGVSINTRRPFNESELNDWKTFIKRTAPTYRGWQAFEKLFEHYMNKRDWKMSSTLLHEHESLFPDKKKWFGTLIPLVDAPDSGIAPQDAGPNINAAGSEYVPVPSADGKYLYFCGSNRADNENGEDIFVSTFENGQWSKPSLIKELSGFGNQAPLSITADGNRMIIFDDGKPFYSDKTATGWAEAKPLELNTSMFGWVGLVQIAPNNQVMILEARGDNMSATDLYISLRQPDGSWKDPIRLDTTINTNQEDRSAYLHPDMRTLYFSSAGHNGLGGMDVFKTTRLDDTWLRWSKPVNLGKEVNTMSDDWAYKVTTDGITAWFSNRKTSTNQDIFTITLPENMRPQSVRVVELQVKDNQGVALEAEVVLEDPLTGQKVGLFRTDPTNGKTFITVPNDKSYTLRLQKEGYYPKSMPLPKQEKASAKLDIVWKPVSLPEMLEKGKTEVLNIFFDYDKSTLRPESMPELQKVAELAQKNNYRINLLGYSDNAGGPAYNTELSQRRSNAARQALIDLGVSADKITAKGYGEANPVADNKTEEGRQLNRRVEVQFLKG